MIDKSDYIFTIGEHMPDVIYGVPKWAYDSEYAFATSTDRWFMTVNFWYKDQIGNTKKGIIVEYTTFDPSENPKILLDWFREVQSKTPAQIEAGNIPEMTLVAD